MIDTNAIAAAQEEALRDIDDEWQPPAALSAGWRLAELCDDGAKYVCMTGLTAIISRCRESDGKRWVHVSVAHPTRMPKYRELCSVKAWALGDEAKAIQVFAPVAQHVNQHPYCLHLWHCLDGDPLPDFTHGVGMI